MNAVRRVWTMAEIEELVRTNDEAAHRAVLAIWKLQTQDERRAFGTKHDNNVGFNQCDARAGTLLARWMMGLGYSRPVRDEKGRPLGFIKVDQLHDAREDGVFRRPVSGTVKRAGVTYDRIAVVRELAFKYRRQLLRIANGLI